MQIALLHLRCMKFENHAALLYYCDNPIGEVFEEPYWILQSDFVTKEINFILPQEERDFTLSFGRHLIKGTDIGSAGDTLLIYLQ